MRFLFLLLILLVGANVSATNDSLKLSLVNTKHAYKKVQIDSAGRISIIYQRDTIIRNDSVEITDHYIGNFYSATENIIRIRCQYIVHNYRKTQKDSSWHKQSRFNPDSTIISLPRNGIFEIHFISDKRYNRLNSAGFLCAFSVQYAVLIAPFIGINYSEGGFNKERYVTHVLIGLGAAALCTPFILANLPHECPISYDTTIKKRKYWNIQ
jgi:hypothetical protein